MSIKTEMKRNNDDKMPDISQSTVNGLQYCLWSIEQSGSHFKNGKTACYWNLIATLAKHIQPGVATDTSVWNSAIDAALKCVVKDGNPEIAIEKITQLKREIEA